jgi:hypothetical protein
MYKHTHTQGGADLQTQQQNTYERFQDAHRGFEWLQ